MKNEVIIKPSFIHSHGGRELFGKCGYYWLEAEDPDEMKVIRILVTSKWIVPVSAERIWIEGHIALSFN